MTRVALITGITGQDGRYLANLLLHREYEVHGLVRRALTFNAEHIDDIHQDPHKLRSRLPLHHGHLSDGLGLANLIRWVVLDGVYHLWAQSHVKLSVECPRTPVTPRLMA